MSWAAQLTNGGIAGAAGLGLLAAFYPCSLSALTAAVLAALAPERSHGRNLVRAGAIVAGMTAAYTLLAAAIGRGLLAVPALSARLPGLLRPLLAPALVVMGIVQTGVFANRRRKPACACGCERCTQGQRGPAGLFLLGAGLALAFCPATAGSFFGVLLPLGVALHRPIACAVAYGLGGGLPMLLVTACLAAGFQWKAIRERAAQWTAFSGWGLIAVGVWLTIRLL